MQGRKIWYQKSLVSAFTRAISNRREKSSIYKVLRERKCEPRMWFSAKLLCKYKDNRHNSLISQVPKIDSKNQNSPVQKMEGKAVMKVKALVAQSFPTLCDPMDFSPPSSSVHEISQAWILERVAMPSSRRSSQLRDQTRVFCIVGRFFTVWATRH